MRNVRNYFGLVGLALVLAACAPAKMAVKPEIKSGINTIAIIQVDDPEEYRMMNLGSPAGAFGAVGGAAMAADGASGQTSLVKVVKGAGFHFGEELTQDLAKGLQQAGYRTKVIKVSREDARALLKDYSAVDAAGADAVLDVAVTNVGYVTEHFMFSPYWRPEARVLVALYSRGSGDVVYRDTLMYGYHNVLMSGTDLDAPEQYHFKDKEAVFAAGDKTIVAGLMDAASSVAKHVAGQLQK